MAIYKPEKDPFFIGEMGFVGAIFRSLLQKDRS